MPASPTGSYALLDIEYTLWLNEAKANAAGLCPISLRLTRYGVRSEVSARVRCRAAHWDGTEHRLREGKGGHPEAKSYNKALATLEARVVLLRATMPATTTLAEFRAALLPAAPVAIPDALLLLDAACAKYHNLSTRATATGALTKFRRFLSPVPVGKRAPPPPGQLPLPDVTARLASDFATWLGEGNGSGHCLTMLKALFSHACPKLPNPFAGVALARGKQAPAKPRYVLSRLELQALAALDLPEPRLRIARDIYLTQYYLHGSRVGVVLELTWQQVEWENKRVRFKAEKGGDWHNVALRPALAAILKHYYCATGGIGLVFPFLPASYFKESASERFRYRHLAESKMARGLTAIGHLLKLPGKLHSHTARHTLATHTVQATGSFRTAQQFLGHQSLSMTEKYVRSMLPEELDAAADSVYGKEEPA